MFTLDTQSLDWSPMATSVPVEIMQESLLTSRVADLGALVVCDLDWYLDECQIRI